MFTIKQNDTMPALQAQLIDVDGSPVNLDLCGVHFHMSKQNGDIVINMPAVITDIENGKVKYEWRNGDTAEIGVYRCEFEVNMPDGNIITVPNDRYFLISIVRELA